jgi:DNA-binding FadR family transcriptional regulator
VREAIKSLESKGVVEIRRGSGTTISRTAPHAFFRDRVEAIARSEGGPVAISSARLALEPAIAGLAARCATVAHVGRMTRATEAMRRQIGRAEPTREHDIDFHQALAEACGNPVLTEFALRLCELRRKLPWKAVMNDSLAHRKTQEAFVRQHERIVEAVRTRDASLAEREMRRHVEATAAVASTLAGKKR